MTDLTTAMAELERRSLIYDRLALYISRNRVPGFGALQRILNANHSFFHEGRGYELRDLEPELGEVILVRSGDGGDMETTYGSEKCAGFVRMYGERMSWRPAPSDSGRHAERRDANAARAEGCQSGDGAAGASPSPPETQP